MFKREYHLKKHPCAGVPKQFIKDKKCDICNKTFGHMGAKFHMANKHGQKTFECELESKV